MEQTDSTKRRKGIKNIDLKKRNQSCSFKRWFEWRLGRVKWITLCNAKYRSLRDPARTFPPIAYSILCNDLFSSKEWVKDNGFSVLGNGKNIKFLNDWWIGEPK